VPPDGPLIRLLSEFMVEGGVGATVRALCIWVLKLKIFTLIEPMRLACGGRGFPTEALVEIKNQSRASTFFPQQPRISTTSLECPLAHGNAFPMSCILHECLDCHATPACRY
jgi:hypothetical protein